MARLERTIQALILFSTALGVLLLYEIYALLPAAAFDFVAAGWVLFVFDSVLTFIRQRIAFYLAFVLALLGLSTSLPQSAHYAFIASGDLVPAAIFVIGSALMILIAILAPTLVLLRRRRG